jgi:hypothetical protein
MPIVLSIFLATYILTLKSSFAYLGTLELDESISLGTSSRTIIGNGSKNNGFG